MPTSTRARLAGALAATAMLAGAAALQAPRAEAGNDGSAARLALAQVQAGLGAASAARVAPSVDLTEPLRTLALRRDALAGADRGQATAALLRPSGNRRTADARLHYPGGVEAPRSPICADGVCVHWSEDGRHAPPAADHDGMADGDGIPDYVEQALRAVRRSVVVEHRRLGWRRPIGDGRRGEPRGSAGKDRADIYLLDLGNSIAGFTAIDPGGKGRRRSGWVAIDDDLTSHLTDSRALLQVTVAHEYSHLVQYAYDVAQEVWLYESTATWIEDRVFPSANLYLGFVGDFAAAPHLPLGSRRTMYGAAMLHQFVADQRGPKAVRTAWALARQFRGRGRSYRALSGGLAREGLRLQPTFARFAAASAIWRDHPAFDDARLLPRVRRSKPARRGHGQTRLRLSRMSYAIVPIEDAGPAGRVEVRVRGPRGVRAFVALVAHRRATAAIDSVEKLRGRSQRLALRRPAGVRAVEVVVANTDFRRDRDRRARYRGDNRHFTVAAR